MKRGQAEVGMRVRLKSNPEVLYQVNTVKNDGWIVTLLDAEQIDKGKEVWCGTVDVSLIKPA